ncbi:MAG: hypothetical protein FWF31_03025, partial [Desulfobulbus sp.]|nr:hypothetical protein [Desulfobulbus sp.]
LSGARSRCPFSPPTMGPTLISFWDTIRPESFQNEHIPDQKKIHTPDIPSLLTPTSFGTVFA